MGPSLQIVFDANDLPRLFAFWERALGYEVQPPPPEFETWMYYARETAILEGNEFCLQ